MSIEVRNFGFYINHHLHPYLVMENEVGIQCDREKEKLKLELIATAKELASKKCYSPIDAKIVATSLIDEKLDKIVDQMKKSAADVERQEVIENTWQIISGELYSPLEFKKILESILKGESTA